MSVVLEPEVIETPEVVVEPEEIVILKKAYDLLSDPEKWCQNHDALNEEGVYTHPWSDGAVQWCAIGAVAWASEEMSGWINPPEGFRRATARLSAQLPDTGARNLNRITDANDEGGYSVIMSALRKAIT